MRRPLAAALLLTLFATAFADSPPVTTQPTNSELEDLRVRVKSLEQENDLLRSTLAAAGKAAPPRATADEKPLAGVESILQEFPSDSLPGPDEGTLELRRSLLTKWIQTHTVGRTITLHARFVFASGINNNTFQVDVASSATALHPFIAHMAMPELEAPAIVAFRRGNYVEVTGQIGEATLNWTSNGEFSLAITLVHATLKPDKSVASDTAPPHGNKHSH